MTTGRINQVNGGTNKKLEPTIGFLRARLRSAHRPPKRTGTAVGLRQFSRESPLFSHRGQRGSASHPRPTDEVRLEPTTLHADRDCRFYPALSGEKQGTTARRSERSTGSRTHHRHSVTRGRGAGDRTVPWGVAREELGTGVGSPGLSHPSRRATGP